MKVVMLTNDRKLDRRIVQQARSHIEFGNEVIIIAFAWDGKEDGDLGDIKLIRVGKSKSKDMVVNLLGWIYPVFRAFLLAHRRLFILLREIVNGHILNLEEYFESLLLAPAIVECADVYQANDLPTLSSAIKAAKTHRSRVVYDAHELYVEQGLQKSEKRRWEAIEQRYITSVDAVITVNGSIAAELSKRYGIVLPTVIMNKLSSRYLQIQNLENPFVGDDDLIGKRIILYQGGVVEDRNLDSLIRMMYYIQDEDIALCLVGGGDYRYRLQKLASSLKVNSRVFFIDEVPQNHLLHYTRHADIGVIPYSSTCLNNQLCTPNKLFEFIAAGLPIVTNNLPELVKIVNVEGFGLIVDFSKVKEAAAEIEALLHNRKILSEMKGRMIQNAERYFWEYEQEQYLRVYQNVVHKE